MDTLDFIMKKYDLKQDPESLIIKIPVSRWKNIPKLFNELGFKKGVEVGVYKGKFTKALCAWNPELKLVGVDSWKIYGDYTEYGTEDLEKSYDEAVARNKGMNVKFMRASSMDAVKDFEDNSLDFVFIDANHDYKHAFEDITVWSKKVRKGGIVAGHDYVKSDKFDFGVIDAVNDCCKSQNVRTLFVWKDQCPSWMYVK